MLAMAAINLPLYDFPCSFYTREPEDIVVFVYRQLCQLWKPLPENCSIESRELLIHYLKHENFPM